MSDNDNATTTAWQKRENRPLVSIVVCCHNRRQYLLGTLESIFAQRYEPVEIVVLDDGSTDGTDELMASYGDRVRYFWQEQSGIAAARTAACKLATGELIAFQDDDDWMPPDRITKSYEALCAFPQAVFATGDYVFMDADGNVLSRWPPGPFDLEAPAELITDSYQAVIWPRIPALPHTTLFRKADGERIGWFDHDFNYASSDKDFYARLARLGPIVYLRHVLSYYRRGHSALWKDELRAMCSRVQLLAKHLRIAGSENAALQKRLQFRLRAALQRIAALEREGVRTEQFDCAERVASAHGLLGPVERLAYMWYKRAKLPLKHLIRGSA